jgi:hypothetical protein
MKEVQENLKINKVYVIKNRPKENKYDELGRGRTL